MIRECVPGVSRGTDHADGVAGHADLTGKALDDDAQEAEEGGDAGGVRRLDALAALESAGVALVGRRIAEGDGHGEGGESEGGESRESEELHVCLREWLGW